MPTCEYLREGDSHGRRRGSPTRSVRRPTTRPTRVWARQVNVPMPIKKLALYARSDPAPIHAAPLVNAAQAVILNTGLGLRGSKRSDYGSLSI